MIEYTILSKIPRNVQHICLRRKINYVLIARDLIITRKDMNWEEDVSLLTPSSDEVCLPKLYDIGLHLVQREGMGGKLSAMVLYSSAGPEYG